MRAEVLTRWIGDGITIETSNRFKIMDDHPEIHKHEDTTGQQESSGAWWQALPINLCVVKIECDQTTLDAIEADPEYQVLWSEA